MFAPHNGKLQYAMGQIYVIWSHYNFIDYKDNGRRNNHTGDSSVLIDADKGIDFKIIFTW